MHKIKAYVLEPNCIEIIVDDNTYLLSYNTVVLCRDHGPNGTGKTFLDPVWDCTKSTTKHTCRFLNMKPKEVRGWINDGKLHIADLDKGR